MKHTKFSKLVSVVMVVAMIMLSAVTSYAAPSVTAEQDITTTEITVTGITEAFDKVGIAISLLLPGAIKDEITGKFPTDKVADLGQTFVNADGTYTYVFTLAADAASGIYSVVATAGDIADTTVYFAAPANRTGAVREILVEETKEDVISTINTKSDVLGIDAELWALLDAEASAEVNTAAELDAAGMIMANEVLGDINPDDIRPVHIGVVADEIDKEVFTAALNAGLISDVADYEEYIPEEAFELFENLTDEEKATYKTLISNRGYDSAEKMVEGVLEVANIVTVTSDNTAIDDVAGYMEELGLASTAKFKKLTPFQKKQVIAAVKKLTPKTVEELDGDIKEETKKYSGAQKEDGEEDSYVGGSSGTTPSKPPVEEIKYVDLDGYDWASEAIYELSSKKILAGYGNGVFMPANLIKRAEFAKVAVVAMYGEAAVNENKASSFEDAKNAWYTPYIGYAEFAGLIKGVSATEFGVEASITRQDIMTILYRIMTAKGYSANTTPIAFGDSANIADYATEAIYALANAGVVKGYEDGTVQPTGAATRAEVAVMVGRFMKLF